MPGCPARRRRPRGATAPTLTAGHDNGWIGRGWDAFFPAGQTLAQLGEGRAVLRAAGLVQLQIADWYTFSAQRSWMTSES